MSQICWPKSILKALGEVKRITIFLNRFTQNDSSVFFHENYQHQYNRKVNKKCWKINIQFILSKTQCSTKANIAKYLTIYSLFCYKPTPEELHETVSQKKLLRLENDFSYNFRKSFLDRASKKKRITILLNFT